MKRLLRLVLILVVSLVLLVPIGITATIGWRPILGPRYRAVTDRQFDVTPERIERGKYLVNAVASCFYCHSELDNTAPIVVPKAGREGAGHHPGTDPAIGDIYIPNITPDKETGIGGWTDDEIARAIREGVDRNGRTLFPIMPYDNFKAMSDEDIASVVVYLRSIPPVQNSLPKMQPPFPISRLIMSVPEPVTEAVPGPDLAAPLERGRYLARMASCNHCHTPAQQGQPREDLAFAGGNMFSQEKRASLNITPDPSAISYFDETIFINFMRTGAFGARRMNPPMPWMVYRNMTDEDLKGLWEFVRNLKPVNHRVDNSMEPTACPVCGNVHGAGNLNKVK
jgi:hypothetical protein